MGYIASSLLILLLSAACSQGAIKVPRGIHMDVEPHVNPAWFTEMVYTGQQFIEMYRKVHELVSPMGIPINADIPLWLNDHPWIIKNGVNRSCTEWLMPYLEKMTIMAYRDWGLGNRNAPSAPDYNGDPQSIVNSCEYEMAIAPVYGTKINAAVETACRVDPSWVSFCLDGSTYMEQQLDIAESYMRSHFTAFDSIVVHYRDSWETLEPKYTLDGTTKKRETYEWEGAATVTNPNRMAKLFTFCNSHAVKAIYLDVQVIIKDLDTYMPGLLSFLEKADANNIEVELMLGTHTWALNAGHQECLEYVGATANLIQTLRTMASQPAPVPQQVTAASTQLPVVPTSQAQQGSTVQQPVSTQPVAVPTSQPLVASSKAVGTQTVGNNQVDLSQSNHQGEQSLSQILVDVPRTSQAKGVGASTIELNPEQLAQISGESSLIASVIATTLWIVMLFV